MKKVIEYIADNEGKAIALFFLIISLLVSCEESALDCRMSSGQSYILCYEQPETEFPTNQEITVNFYDAQCGQSVDEVTDNLPYYSHTGLSYSYKSAKQGFTLVEHKSSLKTGYSCLFNP